jgi:hypothetical protein
MCVNYDKTYKQGLTCVSYASKDMTKMCPVQKLTTWHRFFSHVFTYALSCCDSLISTDIAEHANSVTGLGEISTLGQNRRI